MQCHWNELSVPACQCHDWCIIGWVLLAIQWRHWTHVPIPKPCETMWPSVHTWEQRLVVLLLLFEPLKKGSIYLFMSIHFPNLMLGRLSITVRILTGFTNVLLLFFMSCVLYSCSICLAYFVASPPFWNFPLHLIVVLLLVQFSSVFQPFSLHPQVLQIIDGLHSLM